MAAKFELPKVQDVINKYSQWRKVVVSGANKGDTKKI